VTDIEILARLKKNRARREQNLTERDGLILEAKAAGVPVTHIAEAIGLDRTQVHRIIRDKN
jgi:DNA-binding MarR family transcriptional regulator